MRVFADERHLKHRPETFLIRGRPHLNLEQPERALHLRHALERAGYTISPARDFGLEPVARVHTDRYLRFLQQAHARWCALDDAAPEVIPNAFPVAPEAGYPTSVVGQAGFHMGDMACPINAGTWQAAYGSAQVALSAADAVLNGASVSYGLCRPPGHHAYADRAAGYCFLNNAAIAAQHCLDRGCARVTILDLDVHHGNGTQDIFYARSDVQFVSLHADPSEFYPFFWGYVDQTGEGSGTGSTVNIPLPLGCTGDTYLHTMKTVVQKIDTGAPDVLIVSLGLDTFIGDPYAAFALCTSDFEKVSSELAQKSMPTVIVQEGGYICPELGENLIAFLKSYNH